MWFGSDQLGDGPTLYRALLRRPAALAADDTPMLAVVQHALEAIPGPDEQIIVLLQPTAPFRTPEHIREAIRLLRETQADSVVSVTAWPQQYSPDFVCHIMHGELWAHGSDGDGWGCYSLSRQPATRQDAFQGWKRDGTVYAFWRRTVREHGSIYGGHVRPLIIPPEQSCELDTEADWREVERRWKKERT